MRRQFDEQLTILNREVIKMGALCERIIADSVKTLFGGSEESREVSLIGGEIDRTERDIESLCLRLLLRQQPVAGDLRQISATMKIIRDMERIGDQAEDITEILSYTDGAAADKCVDIKNIAEAAVKMVGDCVEAYVKKDAGLAKTVVDYDDIADGYFNNVRKTLIKMISENTNGGEDAIDLLMIAKYFERIADHAVNIAQCVEQLR